MGDKDATIRLSVVIPVFNGAATIGRLVSLLHEHLDGACRLEIVLVNDGSERDNSAEVCQSLAEADRSVVFLNLARNFGEHNAVMAGLNHCSGDAVVIMDDDMQNPPSEVLKLVEKLAAGYDVVYSSYAHKEHSAFRNLGSRFNDLMACWLLRKPRGLYLSSFKAMNRFAVQQVIRYRGPYPYIDGLILQSTGNYAVVEVKHAPREEGSSSYTFGKLVSLWLNTFTNFSVVPLRAAAVLGFAFCLLGFLGAAYIVVEWIVGPRLPSGWPSIIVSLLVLSGIQLFAIGMVGEYLGRLFMRDAGRPQYVVRSCTRGGVREETGGDGSNHRT